MRSLSTREEPRNRLRYRDASGQAPTAMRSSKFRITLKGDEADDSLRLSDLIDQLNAVKSALNKVDLAVSRTKSLSLYYRITNITMNSPATFEIEAVSKSRARAHSRRVVSKFNSDLKTVIAGKRPKEADLELLESYRALVQPMRKHVAQVSLQFDDQSMELPRNLDMKVDEILGPDQIEQGSIVGSLDVIDVHNQKNLFKIYPIVGPSSIKCHFAQGMLADAISGIKRFVRISGELHYKKTEKFPHLVKVARIDVLPERSDTSSLSNLRGIAAGVLGDKSSTEYVDMVRNGDW